MQRKLMFLFLAAFLLPGVIFAQDGKVRGNVTDKETGEALIGATVAIEGTTLGASTDINGDYILLSVPPGEYTIRASYVGYNPFTITSVRVSANITRTQNFALTSEAVQVQPVEVVAERPLIQRNTTNTVRLATQEDLKNLPIRGVTNFLALTAGVVQQDGNLYVRGGRAGEVSYFLDGANITNPLFRGANFSLIPEIVDEIQLQVGGMTAELGGANSAVVRTNTPSGGSKLRVTLNYLTDDFAKPGKKFVGTSSYGTRTGAVTLGGPLFTGARFFLAGQHNYTRDRVVQFLTPFKFSGFVDDGGYIRKAGEPLPGPIEFKENYIPANWSLDNTGNGNILFDLQQLAKVPLKVRLTGNYTFSKSPQGASWIDLAPVATGVASNYYRLDRLLMNETTAGLANLRITHVISPTTFYEVGISYNYRKSRTFDPAFEDDYLSYGDSVANAKKGFTGFKNRYQGPDPYSTIFKFLFAAPNTPNNSYSIDKQTGLGFTVDFTTQATSSWELKGGGSLETWKMRAFSVGDIANYLIYLDPNRDGVTDRSVATKFFANEYEQRVNYLKNGAITTYGYDYLGNETDGYTLSGSSATLDPPYKPLFAAAYLQNKFEYKDLILNVGVRFDYYDPKMKFVPATLNPVTGQLDYQEVPSNSTLEIIDESKIVETDPIKLVLPRVSFSFPVTDRTVFYAQYGKFAQMPRLDQLYQSTLGFSNAIIPARRSPYGGALGFAARPERTTNFEAGFRQVLTDNLGFTITGFYKDMKDQLQIHRYYNSLGNPLFTAYLNQDFGTVKGLELTLDLRRTARLSARLNYTLSDARGTNATSTYSAVATSDELKARFPLFISPFRFNQTHRGSLLLDYRFTKDDGGIILEGMDLNFLLTFNSGHNYTKVAEPLNLGQASAWNIGVNSLRDRRFSNPTEPVNTSLTPGIFNLDVGWSKTFFFTSFNFVLYVNALNVLNTKQDINVYPTTGTTEDDGWLKSPFAEAYKKIPNYEAFYRAINLQNRAGIIRYYGDVYGQPRQIRVGMRLEY